jgi:hypothetical protein
MQVKHKVADLFSIKKDNVLKKYLKKRFFLKYSYLCRPQTGNTEGGIKGYYEIRYSDILRQ